MKTSFVLLEDSKLNKKVEEKGPSSQWLIALKAAAITACLGGAVYVIFNKTFLIQQSSSSASLSINASKIQGVPLYNACSAGDSCLSGGICCVGLQDTASGKQTCRPTADCAQKSLIPNWSACVSGSTACSDNFVCCVAQADLGSGKTSCRPSGNCGVVITTAPPQTTLISNWNSCSIGSSTCADNFVCCVAQADLGSGKASCRPSGNCGVVAPTLVPNWNSCTVGSTACSDNFVCCAAQTDLASGKTSCRPSGNCGVVITTAPPQTTLISNWNSCSIGSSTCADNFVCCVAQADLGSGKASCRPSGNCGISVTTTTNAPITTTTIAPVTTTTQDATPTGTASMYTGNCLSGRWPLLHTRLLNLNGAALTSSVVAGIDASKIDFIVPYGSTNLRLTQSGGFDLVLTKGTTGASGTELSTSRYMLYGKISVTVQTTGDAGMVVSFITMSESKDEIDVELTGKPVLPTTNVFAPKGRPDFEFGLHSGSTTGYDMTVAHTYTIDWKRDSISWSIDGTVVRTLLKSQSPSVQDPNGPAWFPTTPSLIQFGVWDGGDAADAGTAQWAGGPIAWNGRTEIVNHFTNFNIQCYDSNDSPVTRWPLTSPDKA